MKKAGQIWTEYSGSLAQEGPSELFGFSSPHTQTKSSNNFSVGPQGACFGFVALGSARVSDSKTDFNLKAGQWFCSAGPVDVSFNAGSKTELSRLFVVQIAGFKGLYAMGGPIEDEGRLRYIDGCTDTLLCAPPLLGDPCLNLLHFPKGTVQTTHLHPSTRMGIVATGRGIFHHESGESTLETGTIFHIPAGTKHSFETESEAMNVIAFHPDSDWGPKHEDHPMINRTWFNETGRK